jgi:hypothetical protein
MSGHTNRKRRNGNNPRARDNQQRQRGSDNRAGQPKNTAPPAAEQEAQASEPRAEERAEERAGQQVEQKSERKTERENNQPRRISQSPAPNVTQPNAPHMSSVPEGTEKTEKTERTDNPAQHSTTGRETEPPGEPLEPTERHESVSPRGRAPFAAASRGGHAYIPASSPRMGMNGQNGQNGQNGHHNGTGHMPEERRSIASFATRDADGNDGDGAGAAPKTWRIERLNGGADMTPHEPFRPESRGAVGELIDTLHELFAQDRAMASQGGSARCGICYLHFPLSALEYREAEGFYVCAGCKRALGHNPLMMIRRQQPPHAG